MARKPSALDMRDRNAVLLKGGIYDGMNLYNPPARMDGDVLIDEVRIPCKTAENGTSLQVYVDDGNLFTWSHAEQPNAEPSKKVSFDSPRIEFAVICVAEMRKGKPTGPGRGYLTECGLHLHRLRLVGVKARIRILTNAETAPFLEKLAARYQCVTSVIEFPEADKVKWRCLGVKASLFWHMPQDLDLVVFTDVDWTPLRPLQDLERQIEATLDFRDIVTTADKNPTMQDCLTNERSYPFNTLGAGPMLAMREEFPDLSALVHYNTSIFAYRPQDALTLKAFNRYREGWERARNSDELALTWAEIAARSAGELCPVGVIDLRYNYYIMSVYHRYQVTAEADRLWLPEIAGLQGHMAVHELGGGIGYTPQIKELINAS